MSQAQPNGGGDGYEAAPAEEAVLGALLFDHNAWQTVYGCIGQDDFGRSDHCLIFGTIEALAVQGLAHDLVTVGDCLDRAGKLEDAGGLVYLHTLVDNTPGAANVADYAKLVRERAALRRRFEFERRMACRYGARDDVFKFDLTRRQQVVCRPCLVHRHQCWEGLETGVGVATQRRDDGRQAQVD